MAESNATPSESGAQGASSREPASPEPGGAEPSAPGSAAPGSALYKAAQAVLARLTGRPDARFHPGQFEAIEALVGARRRTLVVQRTGWGKSAVYFIATALLRRSGAGPTVLISPLLALMRDQLEAARRAGIRAQAINSMNRMDWADVLDQLQRDEIDILLISPERLASYDFRKEEIPELVARAGMLVIDEAHCISDWGHDFRPDYRRIRALIDQLRPGTPVLATTATANERVVKDIEDQLAKPGGSRIGGMEADWMGVGPVSPPGTTTPVGQESGHAPGPGGEQASGQTGGHAPGQDAVRDPQEKGPAGRDAQGHHGSGDAVEPVLTLRGPLTRDSLRLGVLKMPSERSRLGWLVEHLKDFEGSGIIYALTIAAADDTASLLKDAGYNVRAYTGRTDAMDREEAETALKENQVKALVATSALGMGFDKPDLGFVIHLGAPSSPVSYYQQVGRAGRATENADVLLLPGNGDTEIWDYFATASMPSEAAANKLLEAMSDGEVHTVPQLQSFVNVKRGGLELLLKVLDVDGAVDRVFGGWKSTGVPWHYDAERYKRIQQARVAEQRTMLDYENTKECRMLFLARTLDDEEASDPLLARKCGKCDNCAGPWYATQVSEAAVSTAQEAISHVGIRVQPRRLWPNDMKRLGVPAHGRIKVREQYDDGRALGRFSDLNWGPLLRKTVGPDAPDQPVPQELLDASVKALAAWSWYERPSAVVSMPSLKHPELVTSLARGISHIGRIPYIGSLELTDTAPGRGPGGNSAFRLKDVWDRFAVPEDGRQVLAKYRGPILLVDDLVDSRWSVTVAARALKLSGAQGVLVYALGATA